MGEGCAQQARLVELWVTWIGWADETNVLALESAQFAPGYHVQILSQSDLEIDPNLMDANILACESLQRPTKVNRDLQCVIANETPKRTEDDITTSATRCQSFGRQPAERTVTQGKCR